MSRLSRIGDAVSRMVRRRVLRVALGRFNWNLTKTARYLGMGTAGAVIRAIRDLGLVDEYESARRDGRVTRGWNKRAVAFR